MGNPSQRARLVIQNGDLKGKEFVLEGTEAIIGRSRSTDITINDDGISREHTVILYDDETDVYSVEDLQSTNGTQVNGKRVRSAELVNGDQIQIGRTRFEFIRD
ncbi:MAG: FHA domain-containing protein [Deltaproteobacteria bacterium]|nr:FHA domain-containing protein [Deltaproteobacteria bacterium]